MCKRIVSLIVYAKIEPCERIGLNDEKVREAKAKSKLPLTKMRYR